MSAGGGESITQCSSHDNQWCCNADATHVNCCQESPEPRPFFALQDGQAYATIGGSSASSVPDLASITGLATGSGSGGGASSTPAPSSSDSPSSNSANSPSKSAESTPVTSLQTSVASGTAGVSTVIQTVVTPAPVPSSSSGPTATSSKSKSKSNIGLIVGCAVGIPLALALIGILIWLLRKRRHQKTHPYSETPDPYSNGSASPEFAGGAKLHKNGGATKYRSESDGPGMPELAGQGVGPGRPISTIKGRAELDSGAGFVPGTTPHAPHLVGLGGGNGMTGHTPQSSWGSAPPMYSPGMNQAAWAPGHAQQNSMGSMPDGGAAGVRAEGGGYIPYRPPPGHGPVPQELDTTGGGGGLHHVPEMAELSTVRTPPEAAELGTVRTPPA